MLDGTFITCAVTGAGDNFRKNAHVPITPEQIAHDALRAAQAGAAIVHCHVRDPITGAGSRDLRLYREVVERIRASDVDVIINLTAGMGGDLVFGEEDPFAFGQETDLVSQSVRLEHVAALKPEICTLDCGSYNVGAGNLVYISTNEMVARGAEEIRRPGVKPELEIFELGHLHTARKLIDLGTFEGQTLIQICLGVPGAAPATPQALAAMLSMLPESDTIWSAFGVGAMQMPIAAQAVCHGGNVRVGLEDNIYLSKGVPATNVQLVETARAMIESLGSTVLNAEETRRKLGLERRSS